jgi:hypothetical protein
MIYIEIRRSLRNRELMNSGSSADRARSGLKSDAMALPKSTALGRTLRSIGSRHQGRHPADDPRIAQSTGPLHEMGHLAHDLMYSCILRRDPLQREV